MKILAVDTALGACSAAVLDGEAILGHRFEIMQRGHAEALAPMVQAAMQDAGLGFADLDRLAVTTGPGTFTGQRVGLAFMRGMRIALKKPLIGITTLHAMAAAALAQSGASAAAAIHDARRGEVYLEAVTVDGPLLAVQIQPFDGAIALLKQSLTPGTQLALAGTAAEAAGHALSGLDVVLTDIAQPDALWVARLARAADAPDGPPAPLYLRAPDAKLPSKPGGK
jgi:tRNA threonylcarbamoyladenosine biosynthesis protein TsaB